MRKNEDMPPLRVITQERHATSVRIGFIRTVLSTRYYQDDYIRTIASGCLDKNGVGRKILQDDIIRTILRFIGRCDKGSFGFGPDITLHESIPTYQV